MDASFAGLCENVNNFHKDEIFASDRELFVVRREVYKRIQERFREEGIEFAHHNLTVKLPPEAKGEASEDGLGQGTASGSKSKKMLLEAGAAAAPVASRVDEWEIKPND